MVLTGYVPGGQTFVQYPLKQKLQDPVCWKHFVIWDGVTAEAVDAVVLFSAVAVSPGRTLTPNVQVLPLDKPSAQV